MVHNASDMEHGGRARCVHNGDRYIFLVDDSRSLATQNGVTSKNGASPAMKGDDSGGFIPKMQEAVNHSRDQEDEEGKVFIFLHPLPLPPPPQQQHTRRLNLPTSVPPFQYGIIFGGGICRVRLVNGVASLKACRLGCANFISKI